MTNQPTEPPKQNTEEKGKKTFPITKLFHQTASNACVQWTQASLAATKGIIMLNWAKEIMTNKNPVLEIRPDGFIKFAGGLPEEEYSALIGSRNWAKIKSKYESEKYLVYDDSKEKDPQTQLYPEFYLWFRNGVYVKFDVSTTDDDPNPQLTITFKSYKEYNG